MRAVFTRRAAVLLVAALLMWRVGGAVAQTAPDPRVRYDGYQRVRAQIRSSRDLMTMSALGGREAACGGAGVGPSDYIVPPGAAVAMDDVGIKQTVLDGNIQAGIDAEWQQIQAARAAEQGGLRGPGWFGTYHTYDEISAYVDTLVAAHPELASRLTLGQSLQGRVIFGLRITSGVGSNKPQIVLHSLQHAREWISGATTMWMADTLVNGYATSPQVRRLLDGFEFLIVPITNPDGYVYTWSTDRLWRKNRRDNGNGTFGVDNNRNWGYQWGGEGASTQPGNETYRGPSAFSEPETQVLRDFIQSSGRVVMHVDVHSYSQLILSPWGYTVQLPPDAPLFDTINAGFQNAVQSTHGMTYAAGPTYTTIYPASGVSSDWTYGALGVLGWGMELRDTGQNGFVLPADQIVPTAEEAWAGIAWTGDWLLDHRLFFGFPAGVPASVTAGGSTAVSFTVERALATPVAGTERFFWRVGRAGPFTMVMPSSQGSGVFQASVTAGPCNSVVQFYVQAQANTGETVMSPAAGPAAPIEVPAQQVVAALSDGFEAAGAWTVGSPQDNATSGVWVRGTPIGTAAQPGSAHSGQSCYFTGQGTAGGALGEADVDGGQTTLTSPVINLAGAADARVSYWRWYSNSTGSAPGADVFVVDVSNNGGASWTRAETVGPTGPGTTGGWVLASWALSSLSPPVAPTASVKVRFIASDLGAGSIVEAAVDDFLVQTSGCPLPACAGDWDRDGVVAPVDLAELVNAWLADLQGGTLVADVDGDGSVTPADIAAFVNGWFGSLAGGCGG